MSDWENDGQELNADKQTYYERNHECDEIFCKYCATHLNDEQKQCRLDICYDLSWKANIK
jgi:hypothetical protein